MCEQSKDVHPTIATITMTTSYMVEYPATKRYASQVYQQKALLHVSNLETVPTQLVVIVMMSVVGDTASDTECAFLHSSDHLSSFMQYF